ncbi:hypothetical protein M9H77_24192 [Catharanthus roseus]|uniref:Uncharacterized protein n=1 Tax=Catharanthus roseus TaxID=4058 RepID=A0ACC0AVE8_CATRO|nr:hypothetical protein M9H77_24192 [Catharanthus roseus]
MHRSDTASCSAVGFGRLVESYEGLETEVGPRADLISSERSWAQQATEVLGQEFLDQVSPEGHIAERHAVLHIVPRTRASSDGVDDSDSGEWIHLKRGVDHGGCGPIGIMLCGGVRPPSGESEGLETEVGPRADLISSEQSGAQQATEVLGQEFLDQISPEGHMYNMLLLEAVGMTPMGKNFTIATGLMQNEQATTYRWIFEQIKKLYVESPEPTGVGFDACD